MKADSPQKDKTIGPNRIEIDQKHLLLICINLYESNACVFTNRHFMETSKVGTQMENSNDRRAME